MANDHGGENLKRTYMNVEANMDLSVNKPNENLTLLYNSNSIDKDLG